MKMKKTGLQYKTVTPLLKKVLQQLMNEPLFAPFRLVGGTNLSLRYGHRLSVDIDLFTDSAYRSLDFASFENWLRAQFPYYDCNDKGSIVGMGRSYYIGNSKDDYVKVDLMYYDSWIFSSMLELRTEKSNPYSECVYDRIFTGVVYPR
jgi:hypothetical protein